MNLEPIFIGDAPYPLVCLNDLAEAIIRVNEDYCQWSYNNRSADHIQKTERVFSYELYHQFRLLTHYKPEYNDLRFDGEIGKRITSIPSYCGLKVHDTNTGKSYFYPDLVLHKGQIDRNKPNQKLIIEIKTKLIGKVELENTIAKLLHYIRELNFQFAVFISVNTEFCELKKLITELLSTPEIEEECKHQFHSVIIMNYNHRKLDVCTLSQIINLDAQ